MRRRKFPPPLLISPYLTFLSFSPMTENFCCAQLLRITCKPHRLSPSLFSLSLVTTLSIVVCKRHTLLSPALHMYVCAKGGEESFFYTTLITLSSSCFLPALSCSHHLTPFFFLSFPLYLPALSRPLSRVYMQMEERTEEISSILLSLFILCLEQRK